MHPIFHLTPFFRAVHTGWKLYRAALNANYAGRFARAYVRPMQRQKGGKGTLHATG